jgi:hypothetical protein
MALRIMLMARRSGVRVGAEARSYLKLRRGYERAGYTVRPHDPPLAFLARLRSANAPGLEHAQQVVDIYLRARFSAGEVGAEERRMLRVNLEAALRSLSRRRAGRSKREVAA